jgi:hypothetical protein
MTSPQTSWHWCGVMLDDLEFLILVQINLTSGELESYSARILYSYEQITKTNRSYL